MTELVHTRSSASRQFALTTVAREIVSPSDRRYGIIIAPPARGTAYIGGDATITAGNGIPVKAIDGPLYLCRDAVGDLVRRGLWAVGLPAMGDTPEGYILKRRANGSDVPPNAATATMTPAAGNHVRVSGIHGSINIVEDFQWSLSDTAPTTYFVGHSVGSISLSFDPPIITTTTLGAILRINQGATSTGAWANIWGAEYLGPSTVNTAVNLTVVEIFDCDYRVNPEQIMRNLQGR